MASNFRKPQAGKQVNFGFSNVIKPMADPADEESEDLDGSLDSLDGGS